MIPSLKIFRRWSGALLRKIDATKTFFADSTASASSFALQYVNQAESTKEDVLLPIETKLEYATQLEVQLRRLDPSINIPDLRDIDEALNGFADKIEEAARQAADAVDISRNIPPVVESSASLE